MRRFRNNLATAALRRALIAPLALVACVGCSWGKNDGWKFASWDVRKAVGLKSEDEKPDPVVPARMAASWTEAVLNRSGEKSKRGFGGRITFFKQNSEDPVRVDGQLVVYAFDETNRKDYETQPTRRYIFPADQLQVYESKNQLGPSYSIWLPWDEAGGPQRKISLIAKFEPKDGAPVVTEQTNHYLAGPSDPLAPPNSQPQLAGGAAPAGVQNVSYQAPVAGVQAAPLRENSILVNADPLQTTSVQLPKKLSPLPGAALRGPRATAPGQVFLTPHMPEVTSGGAVGSASSSTASGKNAASAPPVEPLTSGAGLTARPSLAPPGGYLPAPMLQQAQLQSVGYQSVPLQAPATPSRP